MSDQHYIEFTTDIIQPYLEDRNYPRGMPHYIVAAMPKSGSTLLTKLISALPEIYELNACEGYSRNEQELSAMRLMLMDKNGYVSHQHLRYSQVTQKLIEQFNLIPIVVVRDIFDVIISFTDHLSHTSTVFPMAYAPKDINEWAYEDKSAFMVDMVVPWYLNYFLSWYECPQKFFVTYQQLIENQAMTLHQIAALGGVFLGFDEIEQIIQNVNGGYTRKNVGIAGRGQQLSQDLKDRIYHMARYYIKGHPEVDFRHIGLDPDILKAGDK